MLLQWAGKPQIATDSLSNQSALAQSDSGLTCSQLAGLLNKYRMSSYAVNGRADWNAIQNEVGNQRPVIALINYAAIPQRQNQADRAGHYVVVIGYDESNVYVNDPDFYGARRSQGVKMALKLSDFLLAVRTSPGPNSAVFVRVAAAPPPADDGNGGTTDDGPDPNTVPHTIPPGPARVSGSLLGIRLRQSPAGIQIWSLGYGQKITILPDPAIRAAMPDGNHVWVKVQTADNRIGWAAEELLSAI
jgi:hypothetical protein